MEAEKQNKFLRLDVEVICKQDEFIRNLLLLVCIVILKDFYPLFIKLVWYTPYFVDFFWICQDWNKTSYRINFFEKVSCKNDFPEIFIDKF